MSSLVYGKCRKISEKRNTGALLIGTFDNFTRGDPAGFLANINKHMPTACQNKLIIIKDTGHTYQLKEQEVADNICAQLSAWKRQDAVSCGASVNEV